MDIFRLYCDFHVHVCFVKNAIDRFQSIYLNRNKIHLIVKSNNNNFINVFAIHSNTYNCTVLISLIVSASTMRRYRITTWLTSYHKALRGAPVYVYQRLMGNRQLYEINCRSLRNASKRTGLCGVNRPVMLQGTTCQWYDMLNRCRQIAF